MASCGPVTIRATMPRAGNPVTTASRSELHRMGLTWSPRNSANDADRRPDLDRTVATGVQHGAAAQCAGISPTGARGGPTRACGSIPAQLGSLITTGSLMGGQVRGASTVARGQGTLRWSLVR